MASETRKTLTAQVVMLACAMGSGCGGAPSESEAGLQLASSAQALGSTETLKLIKTPADLQAMTVTGNYALGNDIDMSGKTWTMIGGPFSPFRGTLDGKNFVIKNLKISSAGSFYVGLFSAVGGAIIKNLGLTGVDITGGAFTGALAGLVSGSDITSVWVEGGTVKVSGLSPGQAVGMVIGQVSGLSHIQRSYAIGTVSGTTSSIGGFVGELQGNCDGPSFPDKGMLAEIYTDVTVSPDTSGSGNVLAGGLVGYVRGGWITDISTVGNVTGRNYAGGVIGWIDSPVECKSGFEDLLSRGVMTISNIPNRAGAIGGISSQYTARCSSAFWNTTTDGGTAPALPGCQQNGYSDTTLKAAHPAPNPVVSPFTHAMEGDWGFTDSGAGLPQVWQLNSSSEHITLVNIPNPSKQKR